MTNKILAVTRPKRPEMPDSSQADAGKPEESSPDPKPLSSPPRDGFSRPQKPTKRPKVQSQPLVELTEVKTPEGIVFKVGDGILVRAPWGNPAEAEITIFYQINPEEVFAHFVPKESKEGWTWEGGCICTALLRIAQTASS
ncbi:MAG: hypothetical protein ACRC8A_18290 [Microcoleaceae cyanobacterium]